MKYMLIFSEKVYGMIQAKSIMVFAPGGRKKVAGQRAEEISFTHVSFIPIEFCTLGMYYLFKDTLNLF